METIQIIWSWLINYVSDNLIFSVICGITLIGLILRRTCIPFYKYKLLSMTFKWAIVVIILEVIYGLFSKTICTAFSTLIYSAPDIWGKYKEFIIFILGIIIFIGLISILPRKFRFHLSVLFKVIAAIFMSIRSIVAIIVAGYLFLGGNILRLGRTGYWETFKNEHHQEMFYVSIAAVILGVIIEYFIFGMRYRLRDLFDTTPRSPYSSYGSDSENTRDSVIENMAHRESGNGDPSECRDDYGNITYADTENHYTDGDGHFNDSAIQSDNEAFSKD